MMNLNATTQAALEAIESAFRRAGDCFTDITGEGTFIIGFTSLKQGNGEEPPIYAKE